MKPHRIIKKHLKTIRLAIGKCFLDKHIAPKNSVTLPSQPRFVCLRQDGKIGDYIVSSFLFREIKRHWPEARIEVIASAKNQYLFRHNPHIDQIHLLKGKSLYTARQLGRELTQAQPFDVLIDPTEVLRNRDLMLIRSLKARINAGFHKENFGLFNLSIPANNQHISAVYAEILTQLGVPQVNTDYDLPTDPTAETTVAEFKAQHALHDYLVVNFYGAKKSRHFSDHKAVALLQTLRQQCPEHTLILLNQPDKQDHIAAILTAFNDANTHALSQPKSIFESVALIRDAQAVISPDTAIVHIAAGFHKPLMAFYCKDDVSLRLWHPNNVATTKIIRYHDHVDEIDPNSLNFTALIPPVNKAHS